MILMSLILSLSSWGADPFAKAPATQQEIVNEAIANPYSRYYSTNDINQINHELKRQTMKGQVILVDTRDQYSCRQVQTKLEETRNLHSAGASISDLCRMDPKYPYASVTVLRQANEGEFRRDINFGMLTSDEKNIFTATRNLGVAGLGVAGLIYMLPESISKWNRDEMKKEGLGNKWKKNVKEGPVWDKDDPVLNYVGHPLSGAAYYQVARHLDLTPMQSFGYSVLMSTFFWEYGVESFAEVPSIQDLIVTPIIGSLLGEVFYRMEQNIIKNHGRVMGSESLGKFVMVLLNPAGALSDQINRIFGSKFVKNSKSRLIMRPFDDGAGRPAPLGIRRTMVAIEVEFAI